MDLRQSDFNTKDQTASMEGLQKDPTFEEKRQTLTAAQHSAAADRDRAATRIPAAALGFRR